MSWNSRVERSAGRAGVGTGPSAAPYNHRGSPHMTKRTRRFLVVATGILVVGLGTGLVASYMGGLPGLNIIAANTPDELAYVPANARMVAFANVRDVMDSELRQKLMQLQ